MDLIRKKILGTLNSIPRMKKKTKKIKNKRVMKYVKITSIIVCFSMFNLKSEIPKANYESRQLRHVANMVAASILNSECIILLAETRFDSRWLFFAPGEYPNISGLIYALNINPVVPLKILRGNEVNAPLMFVYKPDFPISTDQINRISYHDPYLKAEGVWMLFLKPVSKLPETMHADASEINQIARSLDKKMEPSKFARILNADKWLNNQTWFELAFENSAFRIEGKNIRDIPLPPTLGQALLNSITERNQRRRQMHKKEKKASDEFLLSAAQTAEIEKLISLFSDSNSVPRLNQLISLNNEFSNAIIRKLVETPSSDLNESLRKLKETIPQSIVEEILQGN